ncbi:MAG TPA: adenylate/guanylate cyclase domain-containing protein [Anaerolineae bacterium]|nr:adenylate/guanylate cyclase domain-containing protein [Anaerolineae bacterium]
MTNQFDPEEMTVLVVDDNVTNLKVITQYLYEEGYEVMIARDGHDAIDKAQRGHPDLILLDVMMPKMDGFTTCQHLKDNPETNDIPIIFMTALSEVSNKLTGFEVGGVDYITKPFQAQEVLARVRTHLVMRHYQQQLATQNQQLTAANTEITDLNQRLRQLFGRFATHEVADELLTHGFELGGQFVDATAMFSDIRSFTTITESQSPAVTIDLLNNYFAYMIDAIGSEGGIVNQMVGDGLMAIFGAPLHYPDHHQRAVRAALKMMARMDQFNQDQADKGLIQIQIGIGIASGKVIAGYLGTQIRATYTCVGDTVNTAARLEGHTKVAGHPILIADSTRQALNNQFKLIDQGTVPMKGKTEEVHVYAVPYPQSIPN